MTLGLATAAIICSVLVWELARDRRRGALARWRERERAAAPGGAVL